MDKALLIKQALVEIKKLKHERNMPIAVIGMDCKFPGRIDGTEEYWKALMEGRDCIIPIPADRWDIGEFYDRTAGKPGKMYVKEGGFLQENCREFDTDLFQMSEREACYLDPQHRMMLEVIRRCMEDSGINPQKLRDSKTGVYIGISTHDYALNSIYSGDIAQTDIYSFTGSAFSMLSGRISYMFGLKGPSVSVDTACSSSLVCIHQACQGLRAGDCDLAIVGGVNLMLNPEHTVQFCKVNALSPSCRCKVFDDSADGYVRSEGCGAVLLKRLDDAISDRDHILAVIQGSAVNNDGISSSITAPNGLSQCEVIKSALQNAGVAREDISFVEAHGTGTHLGDPIEINAIHNAYCKDRKKPLYVGAVKSNIGHLEAAAGMASFIKVVLMMQYNIIPPNLHMKVPNREFPWDQSCIVLPGQSIDWKEEKRIAGISGFGFSGTNAHVIVSQYQDFSQRKCEENVNLLLLSAQSNKALCEVVSRAETYFETCSESLINAAVYTYNVTRASLDFRKAVLFSDRFDLLRKLDTMQETYVFPDSKGVDLIIPPLEREADWESKELCQRILPVRREWELIWKELGYDSETEMRSEAGSMELRFAVLSACARGLIRMGIQPDRMLAEGSGGIVAAYVLGDISAENAVSMIQRYEKKEKGEVFADLPACVKGFVGESGSDRFEIRLENMTPEEFLRICGACFENGMSVDCAQLYTERYGTVKVPLTPMIKKEYFVPRPKPVSTETENMFLNTFFTVFGQNKECFLFQISPQRFAYLKDHGFLGKIILPATAYLEMMNEIGSRIYGEGNFSLNNISYQQALEITGNPEIHLQAYAERKKAEEYWITIVHQQEQGEFQVLVSAELMREDLREEINTFPGYRETDGKNIDPALFYQEMNEKGYLFKTLHQGIRQLIAGDECSRARVELPQELAKEMNMAVAHPALMDACSQVFLSLVSDRIDDEYIYITSSTKKVMLFRKLEKELYVVSDKTVETESEIQGNICIYNKRRELTACILGYTTKRVKRAFFRTEDAPFYEIVWERTGKRECGKEIQPGVILLWNLLGDDCRHLIGLLKKCGQRVICIEKGCDFRKVHEDFYTIGGIGDFQRVVQKLREAEITDVHSIYRVKQDVKKGSFSEMPEQLLELMQQIYFVKLLKGRFTILTTGYVEADAADRKINPEVSMLRGFQNVVRQEYPEMDLRIIDIQGSAMRDDIQMINQLMTEDYVCCALREQDCYIPVLRKRELSGRDPVDTDLVMIQKKKGLIDSFSFEQAKTRRIGRNEIEIHVEVVGLNFHDVIHALDLMESKSQYFGLDCAGTVSAIGEDVTNYCIGDRVTAFAPGCLSDYVTVNETFVMKCPGNMTTAECATIPSAFLTACAIWNKMHLAAGDSILIHAATGAVGNVLIQLAKRCNVEIYATASKKKQYVLENEQIKYIYDSRSLKFADEIIKDTNGAGVNAVINSMTGEYIAKNFALLKPEGIFVELGERERLSSAQASELRKDVRYLDFSLFELAENEPGAISELFGELYQEFATGHLRAIPYVLHERKKIKDVFHVMQQGKHVGKMLIRMNPSEPFKSGTVVILGGMGGIGYETARYFAQNENYQIALIGRRGKDAEIEKKILDLSVYGKQIRYFSADAGSMEQMKAVFGCIEESMPQIRGVIHSAGLTGDCLAARENREHMEHIFNSKAYAAWNLHELTKNRELDFFILFSSVTADIGSVGVLSYACANSYLIGLSHYRRQLGLPALCINWGPWKEVGMLTELNEYGQAVWTENGFRPLRTKEGLEILKSLTGENGIISVMPVDWEKWMRQYEGGNVPDVLAEFSLYGRKDVKEKPFVSSGIPEERKQGLTRQEIHEELTDMLRNVLQKAVSEEEMVRLSFHDMGIDSLMSVEFRNMLSERFEHHFPVSLLFSYPDMESLEAYISSEIVKTDDTEETKIPGEGAERDDFVKDDPEEDQNPIPDLRRLLDDKIMLYL